MVDRRQAYIRWSAVIAGTILTLGLWNLLQLLFVGGALTAIDPDEIEHLHAFGIGTGLGSILAPLFAMFAGGMLAGRLASHYDRRVLGLHGTLVWALSAVIGIALLAAVAGSLVDKRIDGHSDVMAPPPGANAYLEDQVHSINQHLEAQHARTISTSQFLDAARHAVTSDGQSINRDAFVARLDDKTKLSRPEAQAALDALGQNATDVIVLGRQVALHRQEVAEAAEATGNVLLAAAVGLFLCLACAIAGAIFGSRRPLMGDDRRDTSPGAHVTAPYPVTATPPADVE